MSGCFGQYGTLFHSCLEKYAKGELTEYELSNEYKNNYNRIVTEGFPPNKYVDLGNKYYNQGLEFFNSFEGYDKKILGVEEKYDFKIGEYDFTGVIDLEYSDEIVDIKTKGEQHLKRLTKKHNNEEYIQMVDKRYIHRDNFKQLYIYCIPYYNKYKKYPQKLSLNMVRINDLYSIEFNYNYFEKAKHWILTQIKDIYNSSEFVKGIDTSEFWCGCVCSQRLNCYYSNKYLGV